MLFFHPMWDSEGQRLGMRACTRSGYALRSWGDFLGFCGLILLLVIPIYLAVQFFRHQFSVHDFWFLLTPFAVAVIGRVLFEMGWGLAAKKGYKYDSQTMTVTWIEDGHEKSFAYKP